MADTKITITIPEAHVDEVQSALEVPTKDKLKAWVIDQVRGRVANERRQAAKRADAKVEGAERSFLHMGIALIRVIYRLQLFRKGKADRHAVPVEFGHGLSGNCLLAKHSRDTAAQFIKDGHFFITGFADIRNRCSCGG